MTAAGALVCVPQRQAAASASGPVPSTGGFGEMTCQQCHWDNPLNASSGQLKLDGVPDAYTPGQQYLITVTVARADLQRAGFQLSAREDGINMSAGGDAGVLRATDELSETVVGPAKPVTYAQHTKTGTALASPGRMRWTVEWTAPDGGPVVFHAAANAANGDDSPLGDFIYTAIAVSHPQSH